MRDVLEVKRLHKPNSPYRLPSLYRRHFLLAYIESPCKLMGIMYNSGIVSCNLSSLRLSFKMFNRALMIS